MKIKVEQRHLDKGKAKIAGQCPIALAIKEYLPEFTFVSIGPFKAFIDIFGYQLVYDLSKNSQEFIHKFDNLEKLEPHVVTMNLPGRY